MDTKRLNRLFIITFTPKVPKIFHAQRKSFSIGAGQLIKYIGKRNAAAVFRLAETSLEHRPRKVFRKTGVITLYNR